MIVETTLEVIEGGEPVRVGYRLDTDAKTKTRLGTLYQPAGSGGFSYVGGAVNGRVGFLAMEPDPI